MGWGNGIGIGWPNASASAGPPVPQESYAFNNCVAEEQNNSNPYPVGSFFAGDRILINEGGAYGYITEPIPVTPGGYSISSLPFGYSYDRCIDSNVVLSAVLGSGGADDSYNIVLNGTENFGEDIPVTSDGDLDYEITVRVHYECAFNNGESDLYRNGYVDVITNTYNIPGGDTASLNGEGTYAFSTPGGYDLTSFEYYMSPLTIQNTYGPYNISDGYSRFLTDNGNAWAFNWPFEF